MTTPEQAKELADKIQSNIWEGCDVSTELIEKNAHALRDLARQVEELQADAERYRWLKDAPWLDAPIERTIALQKNALWDSEIDAARKAK